MNVLIIRVHPGLPLSVDAEVAGVRLWAPWVGAPPVAGQTVDVELDIGEVLRWGVTVALDGTALRGAALLRGTVEQQDRDVLTLRIATGLLTVETDGFAGVPPGTPVTVVADTVKLYSTGN